MLISTGLAPLNLQSQSMRVIREQVQWVLLHAAITLSPRSTLAQQLAARHTRKIRFNLWILGIASKAHGRRLPVEERPRRASSLEPVICMLGAAGAYPLA